VTTGGLATIFCDAWGAGASWKTVSEKDAVHEANFLKLDCSKLKSVFGVSPRWNIAQAIEKTVEWYQCYTRRGDPADCMDRQITEYLRGQ
jgi:CDP-glucose 4,6-dehydratase